MKFNVIEPGDIVMTDLGLFGYITNLDTREPALAEVTITPESMRLYEKQCKDRSRLPVIKQQSNWPRSVLIIVEKWNDPKMQEAHS